mgnify:CR=1 FL=1
MKINFRKFPVYANIRKSIMVEQDVSFVLANGIYVNIPGIAAHSLAMKIYTSEGEVEISKDEADAICQWMDLFCGVIADSVKDYLSRNREAKCND